jgi:tetratricopeptide (TPR) repeat protein
VPEPRTQLEVRWDMPFASPAPLGSLDSPFADELYVAALDEPPEDVDDHDLVDAEQAVESERLLRRAEAALDELDEADAMSMLRTALRLDPTNEHAARLLEALCYTGESDVTRRASEVRAALAEVGFFARHQLLDCARETLRDALRVAPGDARLIATLQRIA